MQIEYEHGNAMHSNIRLCAAPWGNGYYWALVLFVDGIDAGFRPVASDFSADPISRIVPAGTKVSKAEVYDADAQWRVIAEGFAPTAPSLQRDAKAAAKEQGIEFYQDVKISKTLGLAPDRFGFFGADSFRRDIGRQALNVFLRENQDPPYWSKQQINLIRAEEQRTLINPDWRRGEIIRAVREAQGHLHKDFTGKLFKNPKTSHADWQQMGVGKIFRTEDWILYTKSLKVMLDHLRTVAQSPCWATRSQLNRRANIYRRLGKMICQHARWLPDSAEPVRLGVLLEEAAAFIDQMQPLQI